MLYCTLENWFWKGRKLINKKRFHIMFEVERTGPYERWAWYKSRNSFVKSLAREFEKIYRRKVFIKVLYFEEIKH